MNTHRYRLTDQNPSNRQTIVAQNLHSRLVSIWNRDPDFKDDHKFKPLNGDAHPEELASLKMFLTLGGMDVSNTAIHGFRVLKSENLVESYDVRILLQPPGEEKVVLRTSEVPSTKTSGYQFTWDIKPFVDFPAKPPAVDGDPIKDLARTIIDGIIRNI